MGCQGAKGNINPEYLYYQRLIDLIDKNEDKQIKTAINLSYIKINEIFYDTEEIKLNPLAYALYKGKSKSFIHLHKYCNASLSEMESLLTMQGFSPLLLSCKHGNLELFSYYLEQYTQSNFFNKPVKQSIIIKDSNHIDAEILVTSAVHLLCEYNYLHILAYLHKYIQSLPEIPNEFNIESINEQTGENCALVACRNGNYILIKFLHSIHANFHQKNKLGENAIQVLCSSNRKRKIKEVYECFTYLILSAGVDITYNYEETFLLIDDVRLANLLENQLAEKGIFIKKEEIEKKYKLDIKEQLPESSSHCEINEITFSGLYTSQFSSFASITSTFDKPDLNKISIIYEDSL